MFLRIVNGSFKYLSLLIWTYHAQCRHESRPWKLFLRCWYAAVLWTGRKKRKLVGQQSAGRNIISLQINDTTYLISILFTGNCRYPAQKSKYTKCFQLLKSLNSAGMFGIGDLSGLVAAFSGSMEVWVFRNFELDFFSTTWGLARHDTFGLWFKKQNFTNSERQDSINALCCGHY